MASAHAREWYIRKARRIRGVELIIVKLQRRFSSTRQAERREIFIDTEFGRTRTLWYGFETAGRSPVYFDLHGGGFVLGGAEMDAAMNVELSGRIGCKVVSIDYAKAPAFPYPAAVNQVYAVVRHVYENAAKYLIDAAKMAIGGYSAGGNLATVCCMKAKKEGKFQLVGQVLNYPPLDLSTPAWDKPRPRGSISPAMASMFDACYRDTAQAMDPFISPVYAAIKDLRGLPTALFILGGRDSLHDEGLKYRAMLEAAGVATECHEYPNAAHGFTYRKGADTKDALERMVVFLSRCLSSR
jgi:acetyl esterase